MKEAVVLILDGNASMATPYASSATRTRFDSAKQVCLDLMSDLMIRSKTNEAAVILLKSPETRHHFWEPTSTNTGKEHDDEVEDHPEIPFPNLYEWGGDGKGTGVQRIHPDLLRQVSQLQCNADSNNDSLRGDFCDGIVVAADALYKQTAGKKYQRRIILLTDAEHKIEIDTPQLLVVIDSLRAMDCRLEVIGMDFVVQADYDKALVSSSNTTTTTAISTNPKAEPDEEEQEDSATETSEDLLDDSDENDDENENENKDVEMKDADTEEQEHNKSLAIKRQNESFLLSLTEKTGGYVLAAKELQPILQKVLGQKNTKSTRRKVQFQIAPGCVLEARFSLLLSKASTPTLKKQVVALQAGERADDPDAQIQHDDEGKESTHNITTVVTHWDPEQETREITDIAEAYRYGSDLVPMSGVDLAGLLRPSPVALQILGYLRESQVPQCLRIGPPYALAGAGSHRTCAAIAALARALKAKGLVGIGTLVKTKDHDPILVGLFPLEQGATPNHLCMMQLPFQGDVTNLRLESFGEKEEKTDTTTPQTQATDALIDSLMLPNHVLDHSRTANPLLRSFHQTVVQRVLNPEAPVVSMRPQQQQDPLGTPRELLASKAVQKALQDFRSALPLKATKATAATAKGGTKRKKGPVSYHDFVDTEE